MSNYSIYRPDDIFNEIYCQCVHIGNYKLPINDGTTGQVLCTDGLGTLSFTSMQVGGDVVGPSGSTSNALVRFDSTTGKLIKSSTAVLNDSGLLTVSSLLSSGLLYPIADGSTGQVLTTNGSGVLTFSSKGDVVGPASSTANSLVRFSGTTGKLVKSSTSTLSDAGQLTISTLTVGTVTYASTDGSAGQVLTTNGSGVLTFTTVPTPLSCVYGRCIVTDSVHVNVGDHIAFNSVNFSTGGNIVLDTTSAYATTTNTASLGRITLKANKTYFLECALIQVTTTLSTGNIVVAWYNSDTNTFIDGPTAGVFNGCETVYTPTVDTRVEVRITVAILLSAINRSFVKCQQLA